MDAQYEVWCARCAVSFPLGTKRCMHCGARTVADRPAKGSSGGPLLAIGADSDWSFAPTSESPEPVVGVTSPPIEAEEEETPRRRGLRAGMSLVWMVLLAAGYIWQNCAQPA